LQALRQELEVRPELHLLGASAYTRYRQFGKDCRVFETKWILTACKQVEKLHAATPYLQRSARQATPGLDARRWLTLDSFT
jgi:hypothetical protein